MRPLHTLLRILIGALFAGHGAQKLFGWFGGHGLEGTGGFFDALGIRPGREAAILAGASEAGGGLLLISGVATPVAGAALTGSMVQAIRTVHAPKGPWVTEGGWEYNAVLIAAVLALVEEEAGVVWALAALAAGVIGPDVALRALRRLKPDLQAGATTDGAATAAPAPASAASTAGATP
ncbi:MAG: DoxX family protein [Solirubrobacterales bacterium]|nr:DoxX family protein [Solirubrobacterales bacterium]